MREATLKRVKYYLIMGMCLLAPFMVVSFIWPLYPAYDSTKYYEKRAFLTYSFPFVVPYYLLIPDDYDPDREYPLLLVLHGANKQATAAAVMGLPEMRERYPAFVLLPIDPFKTSWARPKGVRFTKNILESGPLAMRILNKVTKNFSIDENSVYITGSSVGGFGVFGLLIDNPDVFAAAVPVAGGWSAKDAEKMPNVPLWAFHGTADTQIPVRHTSEMIDMLRLHGYGPKYTELNGYGHGKAIGYAYNSRAMWRWLFSQEK